METEYDTTDNSARACDEINGKEYSVQCLGLSGCGEAFCEPSNPFSESDDEYAEWESLRKEAINEVKRHWNYNGQEWSAPVAEPDAEPSEDESLPVLVRMTDFHGGAEIGRFETEEEAQAWIDYQNQGTDCICGCYEIVTRRSEVPRE